MNGINMNRHSFALLAAIASLAAFNVSAQTVGQIVAGKDSATGIAHTVRTDALGQVYIVGSGASGAVYGSGTIGVAPPQAPVNLGGVDGGGLLRAFKTDTSGNQLIAGSSAAGVADDGSNPVKAGCVVQTPGPSAGQRVALSCDNGGRLYVTFPGISSGSITDATTNAPSGFNTSLSYSLLYNGTTWERPIRLSALPTTGVGLTSVGVASVFNTTLPTYTNGQYGALQMNSNGALYSAPIIGGTPVAGSGNGTLTDATSQNSAMNVVNYGLVYNGTNWDRLRTANTASNTTGTGLLGAGQLGFDGTNWQKTVVNSAGSQYVDTTGKQATYSINGSFNSFTSGAAAFLQLQGSASKIIHIKRVLISTVNSTASINNAYLSINSATMSGCTTTAPPISKFNSTFATATAVPLILNGATPCSPGAVVSTYGQRLFAGYTPTVTGQYYEYKSDNSESDIVLNGIAQFMEVFMGFNTVAGTTLYYNIEWTEE